MSCKVNLFFRIYFNKYQKILRTLMKSKQKPSQNIFKLQHLHVLWQCLLPKVHSYLYSKNSLIHK